MKTSALIIDVNSKDSVIARASMRNINGNAKVVTAKIAGDASKPSVINLLNGFSTVLGQLNSTEFIGRVSFVVPESIALRLIGGVADAKQSKSPFDKMLLPWMREADAKSGTGYAEAISEASEQIEAYISEPQNSLNIVNARTLYRYELLADRDNKEQQKFLQEIKAGDKIKLVNSVADSGITVTENNFLNGEFTVTTQTIRDRQGNSRVRAFVNRIYKVTVNGESKEFTASELLSFMDSNPKAEIAGNTEATNSAISALKLRKINAEQLPRVLVAKIAKVENASEGNLF